MSQRLSISLGTAGTKVRSERNALAVALFHPSSLLFISAIPRVPSSFSTRFLPNSNLRHVRAVNAVTSFLRMTQFPTKNRHIKYVTTSGIQVQCPRKVQATQTRSNCQHDMHCITFRCLSQVTGTYGAVMRVFTLNIHNVRTEPNKRYLK